MGASDDNNKSDNRQSTKTVAFHAGNDRAMAETSDAGQAGSSDLGGAHQKVRKDFRRSQHHFSPRERRRKLCGVRQLRRCDNLNFLLNLAEKDEDESGEVDFVDLVSHHNSAFQELFVEQDKMSAWMSFVDSSEEEQQRVLSAASKVKLHDVFDSIEELCVVTDDHDGFEHIDENGDHKHRSTDSARCFAVTANECFLRINRNLRGFLRRNRFPAGELHRLEEELIAFFAEWPSSVYVADLPDGYRRLMLHAVSQYLDLDAHSYNVPGGSSRQTQVENGNGTFFAPPPTPLATYINENKISGCI